TPFEGREERVLADCLQAGRALRGLIVDAGSGIGLCGIFRPRIIARRAFLDRLTESELASAMRHEIAHLDRRDNVWRLVVECVVCLFWFHPILWIHRKLMLFEMEKACDEQVIASGVESGGYANCLLKAAAFSADDECVGGLAFSETSLKRRVRNIIENEYKEMSKMKLLFAGAAACSLLAGAMAFSAATAHGKLELASAENVPVEVSMEEVVTPPEVPIPVRVDVPVPLARVVPESVPASAVAEGDEVYPISSLTAPPRAVFQENPVYPEELEEQGIEGYTVVEFVISKDGVVVDAKSIRSTHKEFERSAVDAVLASKWKAGEIDGDAVSCRARQKIVFKLKKAAIEEAPEKALQPSVAKEAPVEERRTVEPVLPADKPIPEAAVVKAANPRSLASIPFASSSPVTLNSSLKESEAKADASSWQDTYKLDGLSKRPKGRYQPKGGLSYPEELKRKKIEGWATLEFVITEKGKVERISRVKASHDEFFEPAEEYLEKCIFWPGRSGNKRVAVKVRQRISFTL
ncbi:MAG: TonB family protein, partial [Verrucomicrobiota bacterium]